MQEYVIIVAGGKGTRMNSVIPKQFLPLLGTPILVHTIKAFLDYSKDLKIILVLPAEDQDQWASIAKDYNLTHISLAEGGKTRFQSVKNGLDQISASAGLVAIHDGVRPIIHKDIIDTSYRLAAIHKSAIAAVRLKESLRMTQPPLSEGKLIEANTQTVDRAAYRLIQTPQTFELALIKKAYEIKEDASLTDDASVAERAGFKISLFEGSYSNIKITTPEDVIIAEALLKQKTGL